MSILINKDTKVVIQGITGKYGRSQIHTMISYGTKITAGTSPGKGGQVIDGIPIYDIVKEAEKHEKFNASLIYVPPFAVKEAVLESIDAGVKLIVVAAEGVPLHECMEIKRKSKENNVWIVGPNTIGLISPGECLLGSLGSDYAKKGRLGLITRGGTIAIEMVRILSEAGIGQSTCIGSGGDRVIGRNPIEYLELFENDSDTDAIMLVGEIGGMKENECAKIISKMNKKVFVYILGRCAPKGARMGHIGAIISRGGEGFQEKCKILSEAGAIIINTPWEAVEKIKAIGVC